jgi:hypothetical protein
MILDFDCLRDARIENLERLARSLGVRLPRHKEGHAYTRALARELARKLEHDRAISRGKRRSSIVSIALS